MTVPGSPTDEILSGEGLTLRPPRADDAEAVARACGHEALHRWLPLPHPYGLGDARWWVEDYTRGILDGGGRVFVVEEDGQLVGAIDVKSRPDPGVGEIGYWVAPWAWRRGVATRATRLTTRWAHAHGFARLVLRTHPDNLASQGVARAAGFAYEHRAVSGSVLHGERHDDLVWVHLADEATPSSPVPDPRLGLTPGLPDDAYEHDGQITKREMRAVTLALLAPRPGEWLWDVGGGSGSIAIEWMRTHPTCRAVSVESHPGRADRIEVNARRLGVPGLRVVRGRAPEALHGLPTPDAVFVGGGLTGAGVVEACREALRPGGRIVANAVTLESEAVLVEAHRRHGGDLTRVTVERSGAVGGFRAWTPLRAITTWSATIGA